MASSLLISQSQIVTILTVVLIFFLVLLVLGVRRSFILKKENDKLSASHDIMDDDLPKSYKDFTESHLYDNRL